MVTNTALGGKVVAHTPILALNSAFGKYKPEEERVVRNVKVKEDRVLRQLTGILRQVMPLWTDEELGIDMEDPTSGIAWRGGPVTETVSRMTKNLRITSKDIERFSLATGEFQHEAGFAGASGVLLSKLMALSKESSHTIHTNHLDVLPKDLGCDNTKNVTINGDVGDEAGLDAHSGTLTIKGHAGDFCGWRMSGGAIIVKGNAGEDLGDMMEGGEIHVEGKIGSIGDVIHGKIFHKGKLIVDK